MKKQIATQLKPLALAATLLAPAAAIAAPQATADGPIIINQSKATVGGVTPGDAPGFPVTLSQPGSYKLSGNLTVPNSNTSAIEISADHVMLDLGGFAILGSTDCSGGLSPCANWGTGSGVYTAGISPYFNITIRNGTIQGMGRRGVFLIGDSHLVEYLHARSNGTGGILIEPSQDAGSSIVQNNTAQRNGGMGIRLGRGIARNNVADVNVYGIDQGYGTASNNVATRNVISGLTPYNSSFFGNTLSDNGTNVAGGINMGQNLCTGGGGGC